MGVPSDVKMSLPACGCGGLVVYRGAPKSSPTLKYPWTGHVYSGPVLFEIRVGRLNCGTTGSALWMMCRIRFVVVVRMIVPGARAPSAAEFPAKVFLAPPA